jgi:hypothetical protein
MNDTPKNSEASDVIASLKEIVSDEEEKGTEAAIVGGAEKFILAPSLRVTEEPSVSNAPLNETLEEKISRLEEMITETEGPSEPDYAGRPVTGLPWEEVVDAALSEIDGDLDGDTTDEKSDHADKAPSEAGADQDPIAVRSVPVDYEVLRPMVADIIRDELRGVLGEKITANIRRMVHREIETAVTKLSRDKSE